MKLTTPEDFVREEARLAAQLGDIRTGTGYDVHAFGDGDHLMICGVRVPHTRGFLAHSDGDVGLHAVYVSIPQSFSIIHKKTRPITLLLAQCHFLDDRQYCFDSLTV